MSLARIRAAGGSVAEDDAGAGYASLHHILEMKPDFIKLDRHFIQNCHADRAQSTLIEMMGAAVNRLAAWIIAEGVETVSELNELIRLGVPLAQGYLLERPHPEMQDVPPEVNCAIQQRNLPAAPYSLLKHVDPAECFGSLAEAEAYLAKNSEPQMAIITDAWRGPISILERHIFAGIRAVQTFMRIQVESDPIAVLRRAFTCDAASRFDPVAVISP